MVIFSLKLEVHQRNVQDSWFRLLLLVCSYPDFLLRDRSNFSLDQGRLVVNYISFLYHKMIFIAKNIISTDLAIDSANTRFIISYSRSLPMSGRTTDRSRECRV